jgi:hypothetical protein
MGLDMHLTGEIYIFTDWENPDNNQYEDGYRLKSRQFELGYWRKHPDLHGLIVETFADGIDDCKAIHLGTTEIEVIIEAVQEGRLPHTEGFFFGESTNDDEQQAEDLEILTKALQWLRSDITHRSIYYQASW